MKACVLVNASPGPMLELAWRIRNVEGVLAADPIIGEYDIVVTCEAADIGVPCLLQPGLAPRRSLYLEAPLPDHSSEKCTPGLCPVACTTFMSEQPDPDGLLPPYTGSGANVERGKLRPRRCEGTGQCLTRTTFLLPEALVIGEVLA